MRQRLKAVRDVLYVRVRGTSSSEPEPASDDAAGDPWADLWFYGNPTFIEKRKWSAALLAFPRYQLRAGRVAPPAGPCQTISPISVPQS